MKKFPKFPSVFEEEEEWKPLEIEQEKFEAILSKLLSEFNVDLKRLEKIENGDTVAIVDNKLGEETKSLVRARSCTVGLEEIDVEDFYNDMLDIKATSAIYVTTSHFTKDAKKFAEYAPIRLVDGVELGKILAEYQRPKAELAFLSEFTDQEVVRYFKRQRAKKFLHIFGAREKIGEIDRRYVPVGHFTLKKTTRDTETTRDLYVDLNGGIVFHMEENILEEDDFIKKILDLPPESRAHLLDLIEHGELYQEHMEGKALDILEKEKLVQIQGKGRGGGILDILMDEVTSTVNIATSEMTSLTHKAPTSGEQTIVTTQYVKASIRKPSIDMSYDIGHFIESSIESNLGFDPDPINYSQEDVVEVLSRMYKGNEVSYVRMVYLPYYRCKYATEAGRVRFKKLFTPQFKPFVPRPTAFTWIYRIIDRFPAIPYLIIGLGYILLNLDTLDAVMHVFSSAFIFLITAVATGVLLKVIFKTERKIPRYGGTIVKYGFPSIHALASIGGIAFIYFVDPMFALLLVPLGLLYMYSRIKIGVHSETDILGGAVIGIIVGILCGIYVLSTPLEPTVERILAIMFFIALIVLTITESKLR